MPSEDGWEPSRLDPQSPQLVWIVVPGTDPPVHLQIMVGQPATLLPALAADLNAYVEPMRDADSACYTPTNSVATSNHLNGTAFDFNWDSHPFHEFNTFNSDQMATLAELFDYYTIGDLKLIAWGGKDWGGDPQDEMHFQMGYNTYQNPLTQQFIDQFIRPDGFSTFRRGNAPLAAAAADVLARATGLTPERATEILPTVTSGLQAADCTNVNRIAMWLAQCGEESAGFSTTEEFASGAEYEGRADLGNTQPGDGVRFKGRTWIQITGRTHYAEFSQWAFDHGFVSTPTQFIDDPSSLGDLRWAGIGAAWYWTVERPDINELSDSGDVVTVTHRINGGEHGLADRQDRYTRAHNMGDQLLALMATQQPSGEDDWLNMPSNQEKLDAIYDALFVPQPPENIYRDDNDAGLTLVASIRAILSMLYEGTVERLALEGEQASIDKVVRTAKGLAVEQRPWAINRANIVWTLGRTGSPTPPPISPRPQLSAEPIVQQAIPAVVTPEVLPAVPQRSDPLGSMPTDLLTVLERLDVFNRSYRDRFDQLTKTDNPEKEEVK